jgi:SAM-dependent methyltransferase
MIADAIHAFRLLDLRAPHCHGWRPRWHVTALRDATPEEPPVPAIVAANVERWSAKDDAWRGYHRDAGRLVPDDRVTRALNLAPPRPGCDYLDIGCANGVLTSLFADRLRAGNVTGMDFVDMGLGDKIRFCRANLDTSAPLPLGASSFDVITCMETLEHLHDTDHIIGEIRRLLRPNGYAIITVPRLDALLNIAMLAVGLQPPAVESSLRMRYGSPGPGARVSGHVSHFTRRALSEILDANGFEIDSFSQASIYSSWRNSHPDKPPRLLRASLWVLSHLPFKQDVMIVRIRPCAPAAG